MLMGKYKFDEIAKKAKLTKWDKFNYLFSGDKNDLTRIGVFTSIFYHNNAHQKSKVKLSSVS